MERKKEREYEYNQLQTVMKKEAIPLWRLDRFIVCFVDDGGVDECWYIEETLKKKEDQE